MERNFGNLAWSSFDDTIRTVHVYRDTSPGSDINFNKPIVYSNKKYHGGYPSLSSAQKMEFYRSFSGENEDELVLFLYRKLIDILPEGQSKLSDELKANEKYPESLHTYRSESMSASAHINIDHMLEINFTYYITNAVVKREEASKVYALVYKSDMGGELRKLLDELSNLEIVVNDEFLITLRSVSHAPQTDINEYC